MRYDYDMLGNRIHQASMEAGERWMLTTWPASRSTPGTAAISASAPPTTPCAGRSTRFLVDGDGNELLIGRTVYGESAADPEAHEPAGQGLPALDQAGVVTNEAYDFKGNLLAASRQLAHDYKTTLDWSAEPARARRVRHPHCYDALTVPSRSRRPTAVSCEHTSTMRGCSRRWSCS